MGFDSAWTDNPRAPGAIAAVCIEADGAVRWHAPRLVSFDGALGFIREVGSPAGVTLVALDQPTLVPNAAGMRPVERAAASMVSWLGGGVQPANTGRVGMFCADAPVWRFLAGLGAVEDPEAAREARRGVFVMEVFPALALASLSDGFFGRLAGPRYNPARRRTFRQEDWARVAEAAALEGERFGCGELAGWCREAGRLCPPRKSDQDRMDAVLCTLIGLRWRLPGRGCSMMVGDLRAGYMVVPVSAEVRGRLVAAAERVGIAAR